MTTFNEILLAAYNTRWHKQADEQVIWNQMQKVLDKGLHWDVTQMAIDKHVSRIADLWANPTTARRVTNNYSTMVAIAQRYKMISGELEVPRKGVVMPRRRAISDEDIETIDGVFKMRGGCNVYRLLRDCGLRGLGVEIRSLTWASLNGGLLQVTSKKGGKSTTRMVPVPAFLNKSLEFSRGKNSSSICTPGELAMFEKTWRTEVRALFPGIVPYQLRHSYATRLLRKGVPVHVVQSIMGHSDIKTTMTYAHITQADIELVRSSL